MKPIKIFSAEEISEIINFYLMPNTLYATAKKFNSYNKRIEKILLENNIPLHDKALTIKLSQELARKTCLLRYGVEYTTQITDAKLASKATKLLRYKDPNYNNREKNINTCLARYGTMNGGWTTSSIERIRQTSLAHWGTTNPFSAEKIKEKIRQTNFKKYGIDNYAKTDLYRKFKHNYLVYNNIYFDSFPELCFYLYNINLGITIERNPCKLEYFYNGVKYYYYPDFRIGDRLVEIKSDYLYNKMQQTDTKDYAKFNCMQINNVQIITTSEYQKYINWFNEHNYKKIDFLTSK